MGLFGRIAAVFRPKLWGPDLVHPVFGPLVSDAVGDEDDLWQGEVMFAPLNLEIGLTIYAGPEGPCEEQVAFYKRFESDYLKDFALVAPVLRREYYEWFGVKLGGNLSEHFQFAGLTIPSKGNRKNAWSISFDCLADKDRHMYTAKIVDDHVVAVSVDG